MGAKSNFRVFCFIRAAEFVLSLFCGIVHIVGFFPREPKEPTTHQMVFWLSYFGFAIISARGVFKILRKRRLIWKWEIGIASFGFIVFIFTSIYAMVNVENDPHMSDFDDAGEAQHLYFRFNRLQSIASLINGLVFLLHFMFSLDFINMQPLDDLSMVSDDDDLIIEPDKFLQLHFFFDDIWQGLKNLKSSCCCSK